MADRTINVTDFKAKCLSLFDELEARRVSRVIVTRRGKPVAELRPVNRTVARSTARTVARSNLPRASI